MTRAETLQAIQYARGLWPHWQLPADEEALRLVVEAWWRNLGDVNLESILAAFDSLSRREFAPSPGQVRDRVATMYAEINGLDLPDWDEFWRWVRKEASHTTRFQQDDHDPLECPWPALAGVVTITDLSGWARSELGEGELEMIQQAHIRKRFESAIDRIRRGLVPDAPAVAAWRQQMLGINAGIKRLGDAIDPPELPEAP